MNNYPKFKTGDKVVTKFDSRGIISKSYKEDNVFKYLVKFESGVESVYVEEVLTFDNSDLQKNKKPVNLNKCPVCSSEWTITKFGTSTWYDCSTCRKTAEELIEEANKKPEDSSFNQDYGWWNRGL